MIAVGNPFGFQGAMTMGVVHAVGPLRGLGGRSWVQADVRLAPGNSGGPLADVHGRVVGINTMVAGRLALAIPSNDVARFLLGDTGGRWLGVSVSPVRLPEPSEARAGLAVLEIEPGSPAALASLLPGDILLGTEDVGVFLAAKSRESPGRKFQRRVALEIPERRLQQGAPRHRFSHRVRQETDGRVIRVFLIAPPGTLRERLEELLDSADAAIVGRADDVELLDDEHRGRSRSDSSGRNVGGAR